MIVSGTGVKQVEVTFETPDRIVVDGRTFVLSPDSAAAGEAHRLEQERCASYQTVLIVSELSLCSRLAEAEQAKQAKQAELQAKADEERAALEAEEAEVARVEAEAAAKKQAEEDAHQKRCAPSLTCRVSNGAGAVARK